MTHDTQLEAPVVADNWGGLFEQPLHGAEMGLVSPAASDDSQIRSTDADVTSASVSTCSSATSRSELML